MRNGHIVDVLTSVDIQEVVEIVGEVIKFFEGVLYRQNSKVSLFNKVIDKLFEIRQMYKDENNDAMQFLVKLTMNNLNCKQIRKDIEESYAAKSENWMLTEYDERVLDYQKINYGNFIVKINDDVGLQDEVRKTLTLCHCKWVLSQHQVVNELE